MVGIWPPVPARGHIRYVPEIVSQCPFFNFEFLQLENGFAIWDFRGQELTKQIQDRFKQFIWRPRPATLLTKDQQRQIRKNLREYSRTFDEDDAAEESNVSAELIALRKRLVDEWNSWRTRCVNEYIEARGQKTARVAEQKEEIEVWVDEVIDQIEEEIIE